MFGCTTKARFPPFAAITPGLPTTITTIANHDVKGGFVDGTDVQVGIRDLAGQIQRFVITEVRKISVEKARSEDQIVAGVAGIGVGASFFVLYRSVPKRPMGLFAISVGLVVAGAALLHWHPHRTLYEACK